jgi:DNA-binding winged helix-turn-helix (wHTH) protein
MNDAARVSAGGLLTTSDLAARPDFTLGLVTVSPSARTIAGPGGTTDVEPRVMQVLVVLAESAGQVVTRATLFERCWGGVYVGDDSLNRAVAGVRKLSSEIAGGSFEIETIPRTGYRLTGATIGHVVDPEAQGVGRGPVTRRELAGGAIGLLALGGLGGWVAYSSRDARRFDLLMQQGNRALQPTDQFDPRAAERAFDSAVRLRPASAAAWGLLGLARSLAAKAAPSQSTAAIVAAAQEAAQTALSIDPREPNGLLTMLELQGSTLDWWNRDRRLRQILAIDPANVLAMSEMVLLLQAAGLTRESWSWNERVLAVQPLNPDALSKRALKLWILGHVSKADQVIDQLRALYPASQWVWWVRFLIYTLSDRPLAGRAMVDSAAPALLAKFPGDFWRPNLKALIDRSPASIAAARSACESTARQSGELAGQAVMILAALGQVDPAFDIANGFLLSRGSVVRSDNRAPQPASDADLRINTQWLFTPPCTAMRADPRFARLCDDLGLAEYWRKRAVQPDYRKAP